MIVVYRWCCSKCPVISSGLLLNRSLLSEFVDSFSEAPLVLQCLLVSQLAYLLWGRAKGNRLYDVMPD